MMIGGHGLREHFRLLAPLFGLIGAIWALRLVLDAAGAPFAILRLCSVTVAGALSVLLAVLLIHLKRFGGYANVVLAAFLLVLWQQLLISLAIAAAAVSRLQNVYSEHRFTPHGAGYGWHIVGHLTFGLGFGVLGGTAMGCLLLWLIRKLVPVRVSERT